MGIPAAKAAMPSMRPITPTSISRDQDLAPDQNVSMEFAAISLMFQPPELQQPAVADLALTSSATATQWKPLVAGATPSQRTAVHADHCDAGCGQRNPYLGAESAQRTVAVHFTSNVNFQEVFLS